MADNVLIRIVAAQGAQRGKPMSGGRTTSGKAGALPEPGQGGVEQQAAVVAIESENPGKPQEPNASTDNPVVPESVEETKELHGKSSTSKAADRKVARSPSFVATSVAGVEILADAFGDDRVSEIRNLAMSGDLPDKYAARVGRVKNATGEWMRIDLRNGKLEQRDKTGRLRGALSAISPEGRAILSELDLGAAIKTDENLPKSGGRVGAIQDSKGATASKSSANKNPSTSQSNKVGFMQSTGYTRAESGKGGARAGYSTVFRSVSEKGQYAKTIFSRALERTGITGASHLATFSTFGTMVAGIQVSAYYVTKSLQQDMDELLRQGRLARRDYRTMTRDEIYEHMTNTAGKVGALEEARFGWEMARDFAPLIALSVMNVGAISNLEQPYRRGATLSATAALSGIVGYVSSRAAAKPSSTRWAVATVSDFLTPDMVRGGRVTFDDVGGIRVDAFASPADYEYASLLSQIYEGAASVNTMRDERVKAMAFTRGISSPFDVIRANAKLHGKPKMGTGSFASSERAALEAESESIESAEVMIYRTFFKDMATLSGEALEQDNRLFR